jgi:MraZ protein
MLTTGLERCVMAYPMREWNAFEERLMGMSQFDKVVDNLRHIYFSGAEECEFDSVGRLLIPQLLRKHAELQRDAVWVGMGAHLELWDKDRYAAKHARILEDPNQVDEMRRRLAELGL